MAEYAHYCQTAANMMARDIFDMTNNIRTMNNPQNTLEEARQYLNYVDQLTEKIKSIQVTEGKNIKGAHDFCTFSLGESKKDLNNIISNLSERGITSQSAFKPPVAERE